VAVTTAAMTIKYKRLMFSLHFQLLSKQENTDLFSDYEGTKAILFSSSV